MQSHKLVMPEDLNHYGYLFGGNLLKWVDELSWMAASSDYPGFRFVTLAMDRVEFRKSVHSGAILVLKAERSRCGVTSVGYDVEVFRKRLESGGEEKVFSTTVTLVRVDRRGRKTPLSAHLEADA